MLINFVWWLFVDPCDTLITESRKKMSFGLFSGIWKQKLFLYVSPWLDDPDIRLYIKKIRLCLFIRKIHLYVIISKRYKCLCLLQWPIIQKPGKKWLSFYFLLSWALCHHNMLTPKRFNWWKRYNGFGWSKTTQHDFILEFRWILFIRGKSRILFFFLIL